MMTALNKWKLVLYLLAIFSAGAVSGWVVAAKTTKQKMLTPARPDEISSSIRQRVHSKIDLSPEQGTRVDAIIDKSSKDIQSIQGDCMKRIRQRVDDRNLQIMGLLKPEQQKQFADMEQERQRRWEQFEKQRQEGWRHGGGFKGPPRDWRRPQRDKPRTNTLNNQPVTTTNSTVEKELKP